MHPSRETSNILRENERKSEKKDTEGDITQKAAMEKKTNHSGTYWALSKLKKQTCILNNKKSKMIFLIHESEGTKFLSQFMYENLQAWTKLFLKH